jgi:hypothetical protein
MVGLDLLGGVAVYIWVEVFRLSLSDRLKMTGLGPAETTGERQLRTWVLDRFYDR